MLICSEGYSGIALEYRTLEHVGGEKLMHTSGSWSKASCITAESHSNSTYSEGWEGTKEEILLISNKLYWNKKKLMSKIQMSIQDKSLKETDKEMKIEKKHKCI